MKLFLTALLSSFLLNNGNIIVQKWVIERDSHLSIEGRSNINSFRCDVIEYIPRDTITLYRNDEDKTPIVIMGDLNININRFDCHQRYITNDLKKTLKADTQPNLLIRLLTIEYFNGNQPQQVKGWVDIELAGVNKKFEVNYTVQPLQGNNLQLTGKRQILFSDFGLTPPRKLAGLIKVEEKIDVEFQLVLRSINVPDKEHVAVRF